MAKGTQWFHRDWDNIRAVKLFVYLTDVDEDSGPHVFVEGSHASKTLVDINRIPDEAVETAFGRKALITLTGPAGTGFLADTFGVHKGLLPRHRPRLIAVAQYGIWRTPHGPKRPILPRSPDGRGYDRHVNRVYLAQ